MRTRLLCISVSNSIVFLHSLASFFDTSKLGKKDDDSEDENIKDGQIQDTGQGSDLPMSTSQEPDPPPFTGGDEAQSGNPDIRTRAPSISPKPGSPGTLETPGCMVNSKEELRSSEKKVKRPGSGRRKSKSSIGRDSARDEGCVLNSRNTTFTTAADVNISDSGRSRYQETHFPANLEGDVENLLKAGVSNVSPGAKTKHKNRHSESNDSGFGSERKHSLSKGNHAKHSPPPANGSSKTTIPPVSPSTNATSNSSTPPASSGCFGGISTKMSPGRECKGGGKNGAGKNGAGKNGAGKEAGRGSPRGVAKRSGEGKAGSNRTSVVSSSDVTLQQNHSSTLVDIGDELTPVTEV
ncbi:hypothetical protein EGW08_006811 [Elysia chlorotica]|uniref:Uncharacterized protein n=1 Tax=Elysia chlorotica TaxID=188477 RepID=A0A3S1C7W3_ELYCH|nr:hypothetical protein EGW08_006811 [Elysia chlorotica]